MITYRSTSDVWSSGGDPGVSQALNWPFLSAACREAYAAAPDPPQITLPPASAAIQAILTAEHIAKLDRQLGDSTAPSCDTSSNISAGSHISELLFSSPQPAGQQQVASHAVPAASREPARAQRGRRSPAKGPSKGGGQRTAPAARRPRAATPSEEPVAARGLDALAACAALLCGEVELPRTAQLSGAQQGGDQRDLHTSGQHGPASTHAVKVELPCPAAIRPAASRLPEWATAHAAVPEAAIAPRTAPPLWQSPPAAAVATAHAVVSVTAAQPRWAAGDSRGLWPTPLPAVHRDPPHHPTVMLFGTNLRLVAAKGPALDVAAASEATVLQSLEEKIKELNEMRRQSGLPELSRAEALAPAGTTVATMSRPAAIVPATVLSADIPAAAPAEPAAAVVPPTLPDTARLAQPSPPVSPTALRRESADSGCNAPRPSPAKRPRHGIAGSHPAPPRKNESAAPALPSKQGHEQSCAKCGKTETPTWRRAGKLIFCNACGLKHQRSVLAQSRRQRNA